MSGESPVTSGHPGETIGLPRNPAERDPTYRLEVLFRRHYLGLVRLSYCLVEDQSTAEDVVQDAFMSLQRNHRRLRDPEAAAAYLRSAVLNLSRSHLRRLIRNRGGAATSSLAAPSPEERAVAHDQERRLWHAVRALPQRQREVLVCRYYLQLNVAATADQLKISAGSVKRHAHRALHALQVRLEVEA